MKKAWERDEEFFPALFPFLEMGNILLLERTGDNMFRTIPIWEIDYYIESNNNAMIIDLRRREFYRNSHIKGAVNLPYEDRDEWMSDLPMNQLLIFYCSRGGQSMSVCRELEPYGFRLVNIANGIEYYRGKYMVRG